MESPIAPRPTAPPGAGAGAGGRAQRRLRNYLVDTSLQLRLASYLIGVAVLLSIGLGWLLWQAYQETSRVIALGAPDSADSLAGALAAEDRGRILLVSAALAGVLICLLAAAVVITHRIAGPAFAIARTCRLVGEGKLARPRPLRAGDLLVELSEEVSTMVDALRAREEQERAALQHAARILADVGAASTEREQVAATLVGLTEAKEKRLQG